MTPTSQKRALEFVWDLWGSRRQVEDDQEGSEPEGSDVVGLIRLLSREGDCETLNGKPKVALNWLITLRQRWLIEAKAGTSGFREVSESWRIERDHEVK